MSILAGLLQQAAVAGAAGGENLYIEDVFSTYLYTGNGSTQTITNGIDLDGEGGLVWIKNRDQTDSHILTDTERGATDILSSDSSAAEATDADTLTAFNSDGFALGADVKVNTSTEDYVSWTFRKAPKFFDVVTWTGNGTSGRQISHSLDSVPGCVIFKLTSAATEAWGVYHRSLPTDYILGLNGTSGQLLRLGRVTALSSTDITIGDNSQINANGETYVAYLFAHDDGGFGDDGSENVITCGSFTTDGSGNSPVVNLGYEPQWLLVKGSSETSSWYLIDTMRAFNNAPAGSTSALTLYPNLNNAEAGAAYWNPTSTGFYLGSVGGASQTYIYIAIRRGPMKTPTAGTEVFTPIATGSGGLLVDAYSSIGFSPDMSIRFNRAGPTGGYSTNMFTRLIGINSGSSDTPTSGNAYRLLTSSSAAQNNSSPYFSQIGDMSISYGSSWGAPTYVLHNYHFRRAPGFFDVVCYKGTGSATTISHNLGVVPELIIVKNRDQTDAWQVYAGDATDYLVLNTTAATADNVDRWNDTAPTSSVFTIGTAVEVNTSSENYVAYLFASLAGVSKVGTYTGNGSSVTVTTGFQPRFILVRRTDSTGNWIVGDSARGLVAGDDPYLLLNSTAAEDTDEDWVDITATGFTVNQTSTANVGVDTGTYIYLAIS